jgi:hypothetical protein
MGVAQDIVTFVSNQAGTPHVGMAPVRLIGCREGILLIFQATLGDGMPAWIFQRLSEDFLKKLQAPYSSVYVEWARKKPWPLSLDEAVPRYEKLMAGDRVPQRIDGVSAFVVDSDTMQMVKTVFVDKKLVDTLSKGYPLPAAPLVAGAADGVVIGFLYEREPRQYVMRAERIPDEEAARLGVDRVGDVTVDVLRARMIDHIRTVFGGPVPADAPSA